MEPSIKSRAERGDGWKVGRAGSGSAGIISRSGRRRALLQTGAGKYFQSSEMRMKVTAGLGENTSSGRCGSAGMAFVYGNNGFISKWEVQARSGRICCHLFVP